MSAQPTVVARSAWRGADAGHERALVWGVAGTAVAAAVSLGAWGASPAARYLSHEQLEHRVTPMVASALVSGWVLMLVAMMLPTTLPLLRLFRRVADRHPHPARLVAALAIGYLGVWLAFGVAAHLGDYQLHRAVDAWPWLDGHAWLISVAVIAGAAAYQLSNLKLRCLDKCRLPHAVIQRHWQGRSPLGDAVRIGFDHGLTCVGCCWALMLVMVAAGTGNPGWMLVLGGTMAAERNLPAGQRLVVPVAAALAALALLTAVQGAMR
jgi:predicted metal-binding membrane protein